LGITSALFEVGGQYRRNIEEPLCKKSVWTIYLFSGGLNHYFTASNELLIPLLVARVCSKYFKAFQRWKAFFCLVIIVV
jgi:hypothetical protein